MKSFSNHIKVGSIGEDIAAVYLQNKGHRIIDRNYLKPWGEIDIVSRENNIIHFVEVKTISRENFTKVSQYTHRPEENVHPKKLQKLHRVIQTYVLDKNISGEWQLDVCAIELCQESKRAYCTLIENVL